MTLRKIVASLFPHLKGDKKAMAVRVATAESMVKEGWVFEHNGKTAQLTTPMLRFGYSPYFAESRYKLTPVPREYERRKWKTESVDHPEWGGKPHPHHYNGGLCLRSPYDWDWFAKEPLVLAEIMAATMSGHVMENNSTTDMRPFADPKLSTASTCPYCEMDVDRGNSKPQRNGYFYHPNCYKAAREEGWGNGKPKG